ncbi:glycosyltransferase family 2 protein [Luedemannella flava]|uniref:glycosyltransferase family 2 protein n=1 Tax=Luedemannella flava TaxID=349316 RepID=UPI0031D33B4D
MGAPTTGVHPPHISVVVPTYNERDNIDELLARLVAAVPAETELIFVDDSSDDTVEAIHAAAERLDVAVTVHHRPEAVGGLGGAVVEGLRRAQGTWVVVMDADLQHPPDLVPQLVAAGDDADADLVVASRYVDGGNRDGLANAYRRVVSQGSTLLAKSMFGRTLAGVTDPMSGFFAVRATSLDAATLRPLGYKILLELMVRTKPRRIVEVPFAFGSRFAGESKSSLKEGLRFLRHLAILRLGKSQLRMLGYAAVGVSGVLPNLVTLQVLTAVFGVHYLTAAVIANQVAIGWNFVLTDKLIFRSRRQRSLLARLGQFAVLGNVDLVARIPLLALLVGELGLGYLSGTAVTLLVMFAIRFFVLDRLVYVRTSKPSPSVWETP